MIDMNKRYRTRNGRDVRLLCVDGPGTHPVIGIVEDSLLTWRKDGAHGTEEANLIEVRTAEEVVSQHLQITNDWNKSFAYEISAQCISALRKAGLLKEGE